MIGFFLKLDSTKKFCFDAGRYKIFVDISFICSFLNKHVPFVSNIEGIECQENISRVALEYYKMWFSFAKFFFYVLFKHTMKKYRNAFGFGLENQLLGVSFGIVKTTNELCMIIYFSRTFMSMKTVQFRRMVRKRDQPL